MIGTTLSVLGILGVFLAETQRISDSVLWVLGIALVSCLLANVYIVGLNQLTDVAIDRINKPYLPLAQGTLQPEQARWIVGVCGGVALGLALLQGGFLWGTVLVSILIGTAYSLPPLRLKRFSGWASLCILVVRGVVVNLGLYGYFAQALAPSVIWPPRLLALTVFMVIFGIVIALFKDIPDTVGDKLNNIQTLSVQWGRTVVFRLCIVFLVLDYLGLMAFGLGTTFWSPAGIVLLIASHVLLLGWLGYQSRTVSQFTEFYQFIWRLFYLEYLLFPLTCLL